MPIGKIAFVSNYVRFYLQFQLNPTAYNYDTVNIYIGLQIRTSAGETNKDRAKNRPQHVVKQAS